MKNLKVALDCDGVLIHFYKGVCSKYNFEFKRINQWNSTNIDSCWNEIENDMDLWDNLEVMNTPDFEFDCYLTAIPPHLKESRLNWLKKHNFPEKPLYVATNKVEEAEKYNLDILIDDKPSNIISWIKSGRTAIQYIPQYADFPIVSKYNTRDFREIKTLLNNIKNEREKNSKLQIS